MVARPETIEGTAVAVTRAPIHVSTTTLEHNSDKDNSTAKSGGDTPRVDSSHASGLEAQPVAAAAAAVDAPARLSRRVVLVLFALCMAMFLAALDQTIITTALPTIAADLKASEAEYAWVGSTYLVVAAAFIPIYGKISDIFGRKPILLLANAVFFVGSLLCGLSANVKMLLAGRALQGMGAGGINTMVNVCISDLFSMRERGFYLGILGVVFAVASAIGPILGGSFAEKVSWRWGFFINLPLDGVAFVLLLRFLHLTSPKTPLLAGLRAIDGPGVLFVVGGTLMILSGITVGGILAPWSSTTVLCLLVFGAVSIGLFVLIEWKTARYPIMPLRLWTVRSNVAALTANFAHGLVFMAGTYYLPFYFQVVLGASPVLSGVELMPYVIVLSSMATVSGVIIKVTGHYVILIVGGLALMTLGNGLFIDLQTYASWPRIILFQIIAAVGVGALFQAPLVALQAHVAAGDIAVVTGAFAYTRHLAAALSVGVGGAVLQNEIGRRAVAAASTLSPNTVATLRGGGIGASTTIASHLSETERHVVLAIVTRSLRTMWTVFTVIAGLGMIAACFVRPRVLNKQREEAKTGLEELEKNRRATLEARSPPTDDEKVTVGRESGG